MFLNPLKVSHLQKKEIPIEELEEFRLIWILLVKIRLWFSSASSKSFSCFPSNFCLLRINRVLNDLSKSFGRINFKFKFSNERKTLSNVKWTGKVFFFFLSCKMNERKINWRANKLIQKVSDCISCHIKVIFHSSSFQQFNFTTVKTWNEVEYSERVLICSQRRVKCSVFEACWQMLIRWCFSSQLMSNVFQEYLQMYHNWQISFLNFDLINKHCIIFLFFLYVGKLNLFLGEDSCSG